MEAKNKRKKQRLKRIVPLIVFSGAALLLLGDSLSNKVLLYGRDTVSHDYIVFYYGWEVVRQTAKLPLWIPHLFCGLPFLGSFAFCPFYPTNPIALFLPMPFVFNLQYVMSLIVAGLTFYYCCRSFGMTWVASIFGGLLFMSSGHLVSLVYPGHLQKVQAIVWLPLVIGSAVFYCSRGNVRYIVFGSIGLAMQLIASHAQIFFYTVQLLILIFLFDFARSFRLWERKGNKELRGELNGRSSVKFIKGVVVPAGSIVILGFMLSGAQLIPGMEMAAVSNRRGGVPYEEAIGGSFPPEELPELLLPRVMGDSTEKGYGTYKGRWKERLVSDYAGAGVWLFALFGLFAARSRWRWFFGAVFLVSAALACGKFSFLYRFFYHFIPGYNRFRSPATIMVVMTFSLILIAMMGFDHFWRKASHAAFSPVFFRRFLCLSSVFFAIALIGIMLFHRGITGIGGVETKSLNALNFPYLIPAATSVAIKLGILLFLSALIVRFHHRAQHRYILTAALILVAFFDLRSNDRIFINLMPVGGYHTYLFDYEVDNVIKETEPAYPPPRLLDTRNLLVMRMIMRDISTPHGYHPVRFQRYDELVDKYWFESESFLRLFNVSYVLSGDADKFSRAGYRPRAKTAGQTLLRAPEDSIAYLYVPRELEKTAPETALDSLPDEIDPRRLSVIEIDEGNAGGRTIAQETDPKNVSYRMIDYTENKVEIGVETPEEKFMVISEPNFSGWVAEIDGDTRLPIYTTNHFFRGVKIPGGEHLLTFEYRPFSFRLGLYFTLSALLFVVVLLIVERSMRKSVNLKKRRFYIEYST